MVKIFSFIALFLSMFIKTYSPMRVYVSKSALSYPRTQHIIRRIKKLNRKALIIYIPTNIRVKLSDSSLVGRAAQLNIIIKDI